MRASRNRLKGGSSSADLRRALQPGLSKGGNRIVFRSAEHLVGSDQELNVTIKTAKREQKCERLLE